MFLSRYRAVVALALALAAAPPARADNLDVALVSEMWGVVTKLEEHKVENVGVLNFAVRKGKGADTFSLGTLSANMPARIEAALVLTNRAKNPKLKDAKDPIGVIKDANAVVVRNKVAWHARPADRAKLFAPDYPLAWGTSKVKADAFLTGRVSVSDDLSEAEVTVEAILAAAPTKPVKLTTFKVKTDRELLRELGQSFAVSRGGKTRADRDKQAVADARRRDLTPGLTADLNPDNIAGIKFRVLYDGVAQTIQADDRSPGEWRVDPPRTGQKVALEIGHNGQASDKLGVTVRVNGRSVWTQSTGPDNDPDTGIWVMEPGKPAFAFNGFFMTHKGDNLIPFKVLSEDESAGRAAEMGERAGVFDVDVFASRAGGGDGEVLSISRGLNRSAKPGPVAKSCDDLRAQLLEKNAVLKRFLPRSAGLGRDPGGLVDVDDKTVTGPEVPGGDLADRQRVGRLSVRYYDPKGSAALQISK